jgi:hypothetical protein
MFDFSLKKVNFTYLKDSFIEKFYKFQDVNSNSLENSQKYKPLEMINQSVNQNNERRYYNFLLLRKTVEMKMYRLIFYFRNGRNNIRLGHFTRFVYTNINVGFIVCKTIF